MTVLVEVKNLREWLYPASAEIYQLHTKACLLQLEHEDHSFVPVLVCRRGHKTLFRMAKSLGFYVIDSRRQFILPSADVTEKSLLEVRHGLGYADLVSQATADDLVVKHFRDYLPREAPTFASRWRRTAPVLQDLFARLRVPSSGSASRGQLLDELRSIAADELEDRGGW